MIKNVPNVDPLGRRMPIVEDDKALEPVRVGLEAVIKQLKGDRTNREIRRRALSIYLQGRPDLQISQELRERLLDHEFTSEQVKYLDKLGFTEAETYGPEARRIDAAGGEAVYLRMQELARAEGVAIDDKSFGYLRDRAWRKHPALAPKVRTAPTLSLAMAAAQVESKKYLEPHELANLVAEARPDLLLSEYSRRGDCEPETFSDEQESAADVLEKFTSEAVAWAEGVGVIDDPKDYRQRNIARSRYASCHPKRVPPELVGIFAHSRRRGAA